MEITPSNNLIKVRQFAYCARGVKLLISLETITDVNFQALSIESIFIINQNKKLQSCGYSSDGYHLKGSPTTRIAFELVKANKLKFDKKFSLINSKFKLSSSKTIR